LKGLFGDLFSPSPGATPPDVLLVVKYGNEELLISSIPAKRLIIFNNFLFYFYPHDLHCLMSAWWWSLFINVHSLLKT